MGYLRGRLWARQGSRGRPWAWAPRQAPQVGKLGLVALGIGTGLARRRPWRSLAASSICRRAMPMSLNSPPLVAASPRGREPLHAPCHVGEPPALQAGRQRQGCGVSANILHRGSRCARISAHDRLHHVFVLWTGTAVQRLPACCFQSTTDLALDGLLAMTGTPELMSKTPIAIAITSLCFARRKAVPLLSAPCFQSTTDLALDSLLAVAGAPDFPSETPVWTRRTMPGALHQGFDGSLICP